MFKLIPCICLILTTLQSYGQQPKEAISDKAKSFLEEYVKKNGGKEKCLLLNFRSYENEITTYTDKGLPQKIYKAKYFLMNDSRYAESYLENQLVERLVITPRQSWTIDSNNTPQVLDANEIKYTTVTARFTYLLNLVNLLDDKNVSVDLVDEATIENAKCTVIKINCKLTNHETHVYITPDFTIARRKYNQGKISMRIDTLETIRINGVHYVTKYRSYINEVLNAETRLIQLDVLDKNDKAFEIFRPNGNLKSKSDK